MKRTLLILLYAIQLQVTVCAQSPNKLIYQAVVRNSNNQLVANHKVSMQISILQGSTTGTAVYVEIQHPTTNANGLVGIEIGGGTGFSDINWANGPYFIKTETDPKGGINYIITGTSQLLSVPYALHATTAERLTGTIDAQATHYVGELFGGGVVFWVNKDGTHGLICSMVNLGTPKEWSDETGVLSSQLAKSDRDGQSNTTIIVSRSVFPGAARSCNTYVNADYGTGVFSDWYLPSREELNCLWNNIYSVNTALEKDGNDATTILLKVDYWTSTEFGSDEKRVWIYSFVYGYVFYNLKTWFGYVRAVRAF